MLFTPLSSYVGGNALLMVFFLGALFAALLTLITLVVTVVTREFGKRIYLICMIAFGLSLLNILSYAGVFVYFWTHFKT